MNSWRATSPSAKVRVISSELGVEPLGQAVEVDKTNTHLCFEDIGVQRYRLFGSFTTTSTIAESIIRRWCDLSVPPSGVFLHQLETQSYETCFTRENTIYVGTDRYVDPTLNVEIDLVTKGPPSSTSGAICCSTFLTDNTCNQKKIMWDGLPDAVDVDVDVDEVDVGIDEIGGSVAPVRNHNTQRRPVLDRRTEPEVVDRSTIRQAA